MYADIRDFAQPASDFDIGGVSVQQQSSRLQARSQWYVEALAQISVEAFNLALGARSVGTAYAWDETVCVGEVEQCSMKSMQSDAVSIARDDHTFGVVEQHLARDATEVFECLDQTGIHRVGTFIGGKADIARSAAAERGHERQERRLAPPKHHEICLHLHARRRFETHYRIGPRHWLVRPDKCFDHADATAVTALGDLAGQHRGRDPIRTRLRNPLDQISFEWVQLARTRSSFSF